MGGFGQPIARYFARKIAFGYVKAGYAERVFLAFLGFSAAGGFFN